MRDIRFGIRILLKNTGFTIIVLVILALGIGFNTAIFSVVNAVLINPLPYKEPDRLMMIWHENRKLNESDYPFSYPNYIDMRDKTESFDDMAAISPVWSLVLRGDGDPERLEGHFVTASFFRILGVRAYRGRVFSENEDKPDAEKVALISHKLWHDRFGGVPDIVGKNIRLGPDQVSIIGVMPEGFNFLEKVDLWVPMAMNPIIQRGRAVHFLRLLGQLRPGVSYEKASTEVASVARSLEQQYPDSNTGLGALAVSLRQVIVGEVRPWILLLWAAVGLVLLITCVNVANLLLARSMSREKEIAVRMALGASKWRLVRQLLTESALLAILGGLLGLMFAYWGVDIIRILGASEIPRIDEISVSPSVLVFTFLASILTGIIFGLAPAIHTVSFKVYDSLKDGSRTDGSRRSRLGSVLVVAETALALMLLIGAGLVIRSFIKLVQVNPGFAADNLLTLQIALPPGQYQQANERNQFYKELFDSISTIPGVESVGGVTRLPMRDEGVSTMLEIEGRPVAQGERPEIQFRRTSPDYFNTMRIPVSSGRLFTPQDDANNTFVAVINDKAAEMLWPKGDALGKRVRFFGNSPDGPWAEIIGVAGNVRHFGLDEDVRPEIYMSFEQGPPSNPLIAVRTSVDDPTSIVSALRRKVRAINSELTLYNFATMNELVSEKLAQRRFSMTLLGMFAALALVLAMTGIYGVVSYAVSQRTSEIGLRMALGAEKQDILKLVLGHGMIMTLSGVAIGLIGAVLLSRYISSLLYNLSSLDITTFIVAPALLAIASLVACWLPAHRAMKVDPMVALRYE